MPASTLARALGELGSTERALNEAEAAHAAFEELTATPGRGRGSGAPPVAETRDCAAGPLTRRELQVIALVSAGRSNREIAAKLVVSEHTVHRHISNILRKLGEPTRAAAAARATRDGLVQPESWPVRAIFAVPKDGLALRSAPKAAAARLDPSNRKDTTCLSSRSS